MRNAINELFETKNSLIQNNEELEMGLITEEQHVSFQEARLCDMANAIFDDILKNDLE